MGTTAVRMDSSGTVPVSISGVLENITAYQMTATFNGNVVELEDVDPESLWVLEYYVIEGDSVDTLNVAVATGVDTLTDGRLCDIIFQSTNESNVGDSSVVHIESFWFSEDPTVVAVNDGLVYITPPLRSLGDVTGNGAITALDGSWILQYKVGNRELDRSEQWAADVSRGGGVTAFDASLILRYVVGKITEFPGGGVIIILGEEIAFKPTARSIALGKPQARVPGQISIPVIINEMNGVFSGELELVGGVDGVDVLTTSLTNGYLLAHGEENGRIRVAFAGTEASAGSGNMLELVFDKTVDLGSLRLERVQLNEGMIPVRIGQFMADTPTVYRLSQNHPNPFNPETIIRYDVPRSGNVSVVVYNVLGQEVQVLMADHQSAGHHEVIWNGKDDAGRNVASGVYLFRMEAGDFSATRKMVLMR